MVNPIGSQDPADFKVNVGNLDKAMNDQANQSWTDRFGIDRLTWFGIETKTNEAINGLAFQIPVDYTAGLNVNANGFTVTYNGVVYAPQPSAVPFTTGAWDASKWYPIQNLFNQNNLLVFDDYASASAAAATMPDGVKISVEKDETKSSSPSVYYTSSGSLIFYYLRFPDIQSFGANGTSDASLSIESAIDAGGRVVFQQGSFNVQNRVFSKSKALDIAAGFEVYKTGTTDITLANAQNLPSMISHDSYEKFDAAKFWKIGPTVMAYGDSNTAWVDASGRIGVGQGSWPAYLEAFLGQYVHFAEGRVRGDGSPGQTSQYALDNLDTFIASIQPQITILGWGTNDIASGVTKKQYIQNMALLISRLQATGQCVIVLGIPWHVSNFEKSKAWNSSLEELCRNYRVKFIPVYSLFANSVSTYFASDGVHYTAQANQILAKLIGEAILNEYSLPKNKMILSAISSDSLDGNVWSSSSVLHTFGAQLQTVQTPDQYVRRIFPYSLKITAGSQVQFSGAGPFCAFFSWPDSSSASWTLNGGAYSPITRGSVVRINSVSARLDGSSSSFRVGSTSGDIYLCATASEFPTFERTFSSSEIRNGLYTPGKLIKVKFGQYVLQTTMIPVSGSTDIGYAQSSSLQNVGPRATRTAITSAPEGFLFLESDNELLFKFSGGSWVQLT